VICVAVDVEPETVAVTRTVSPDFTLAIPDSPPLTLDDEFTVKVPDVPSALFTVRVHVVPEVSVTAETVPVRSAIVSYPFGPFTVYSPCTTAPPGPPPKPPKPPGPPKPPEPPKP
jgi:hypothetical protein